MQEQSFSNFRYWVILIAASFTIMACHEVKEKAKETLNKGGEVVGQTATEVIEGVSKGVDQSLQCDFAFAEAVSTAGISHGASAIESDSSGGNNNVLALYLIFTKDFSGRLSARVVNEKGLESGRAVIDIAVKAGTAGYYDFRFDRRTEIASKSRIEFDLQ